MDVFDLVDEMREAYGALAIRLPPPAFSRVLLLMLSPGLID